MSRIWQSPAMDATRRNEGSADGLFAWIAAALPAAVALWRAAGHAQWRGDLPAVRDLGLASVGMGGAVSTPLTQLFCLAPLGPMPFRAAMASAAALGLASFLVFRIARRLVGEVLPPWLVATLSATAAVMAGLSASWQREATVGGGACIAAALGLAALDQTMRLTQPTARTLTPESTAGWIVVALLGGATLAESMPAGIAVLLVASVTAVAAGKRPPLRMLPVLALLALAVFALLSLPALLRPFAPRSWSDVGRALSAASLDPLGAHTERTAALHAWLDETGAVALAFAAVGLVRGLWRESRRIWLSVPVGLILLDLAYPLAAAPGIAADPLAPLRALALAALSAAAAIGVAEVVVFLRTLEVPMARIAAILAVVFHITVVAVASEEAAFAADRSEHGAADEWTDEALERLPPNAAVLVHSPALTWRLWTAQTLVGQRPDVIVIPALLLKHGQVTDNLVPSAPDVVQLLRDYALTSQASEYGMSLLADSRPLLCELDPRWDDRALHHLTVEGAWLRYEPQVIGRADHKLATHVLSAEGRIAAQVHHVGRADDPTAQVIARTLKEHVAALSLLGLGVESKPLVDAVERLTPADPFIPSARLRIAHAERDRTIHKGLDLRDLLRF
jgi:hypothetical protein